MATEYPLITTVVASLFFAFVFGYIAKRLRLPAIVGYLLAGVLIGPNTPGFAADVDIAMQLAEIGIILLMFGVGLHFSISDLMAVRKVALPGAFVQMAFATGIGAVFAHFLGYSLMQGVIFGFSLSVASTVVLLRALESRHAVKSESGKIAVGWLVVEDIAMVMAIVMLPVLGAFFAQEVESTAFDWKSMLIEMATVLTKIGIFAALMVVFGQRILPVLLVKIHQTKSRELSSLGTLAIALGFAYIAYMVFDASFALGAFLAGLVLNESEIGHKAAEQSLPMRDTFAVLFFVSVGMLFDPTILLRMPEAVIGVLAIIICGKMLGALIITMIFKVSKETSTTVAISLAQIGEFSFIFAGMGLKLSLITQDLYDLVLAGAILSIAINPFLFKLSDQYLLKDSKKKEKAVT